MMRYQKIVAVLMTFLVLLNVSACARTGIQDDLQSSRKKRMRNKVKLKKQNLFCQIPGRWSSL